MMVFDVRRKIVRPIVLGDKVEVRNTGRVEGSQNRVFSRVTYGSRRESLNEVGVIRGGCQ